MKLCKDCKWGAGDDLYMKCKAPQNVTSSMRAVSECVTGQRITVSSSGWRYIFCSTHREDRFPWIARTCGRWGRWYVDKRDGDVEQQ